MIFWIVVAGLLVPVVILLLLPILRAPTEEDSADRQQQNIQIAREKKALLERQLEREELDQAGYDDALKDLERSLALDLERKEVSAERAPGRWAGWFVAGLIPLVSVFMYLELGEYRVIENPKLAEVDEAVLANNNADHQNMSIEMMLDRVKQRLQDNPDDAEGWFIMGRTLMAMKQVDSAVTAFQRTYELVGEDPGVMFTLADALALQNNGLMAGEPEQLVKRGLQLSPRDSTGLWLAGLAAEQRNDFKLAHKHWSSMLPLLNDDAESIAEINRLLAVLEERDPGIESLVSNSAAPVAASISVSVDLAESLKANAAPGDAVFIYAKAMQGPPMPLAVKRVTVRDLPVEVSLSDMDAMMPTMKLSSFDQVIVGARVSKSGNPVAQAGDLFVEMESIDSKNPPADLYLEINQVK
jgi:cytochrome c-type biogenesis protein CcmH